jgi:NAD(P)-dependent dehydrogenase (short-subunit alcohol dehydrogenase family)
MAATKVKEGKAAETKRRTRNVREAEAVARARGGRTLVGRVALVTGASRGIGAAIARTLGAEGATVAVNYVRGKAPAERVAEEIATLGGQAATFQADVGDETQCAHLATQTIERFGHIDFLVNNAGVLEDQWFARMERLSFDRILQTNLASVFSMMKAVLPHMEARRFGRIVNMASFVGQTGNITQANYAAAKAGMIGLTKVVALEYANKGITANCVAPGFIGTEMVSNLQPKIQEMLLSKIPMGRFGMPEEVAKGVLYLVRDADYVTGSSLCINGGLVTAY